MKFVYFWFVVILTTNFVEFSHQLGSGAPTTACSSLLPIHRGILPQTTPSPYVLTTSVAPSSGNILIRISAADRNLAGFLIQGRRVAGNMLIGSFQAPSMPPQYQPITCSGVGDTATHTNPQMKSEVVLEWIPPINFSGQVFFTGTVLQEFATFWGGVRSPTITI